jgi:hypothetical protein
LHFLVAFPRPHAFNTFTPRRLPPAAKKICEFLAERRREIACIPGDPAGSPAVRSSMSSSTLAKVTAKTAAEVCKTFPLGDDAKTLLRDGMTPPQFLAALTNKQLAVDAVRFLAHALPKREAVWWACLCTRAALGTAAEPAMAAAVQAAEKWVGDPSEDNRRAAGAAAEAAGMSNPAGCAAMAAFWSGGSLAPPKLPVVPPGEHLTGHGVAGAVLLAAVLTEPQKAAEKHRRFLALGAEVADGANRWKEPAK